MYWILLDNYIVLLSCFPTIASHVLLLSLLWWHSCLGTVLFTTFNVFMPQLLAGDGWRRPAMELLWAESACLHRLSQILGHCLKHNTNFVKASMPGPGKKIFVIMQEVVFVLNFNKCNCPPFNYNRLLYYMENFITIPRSGEESAQLFM